MRLRKKILSLLVVVVGLGSFSSFIGIPMASPAYAQASVTSEKTTTTSATTSDSTSKNTMEQDFRELADVFLKIGYLILWPLIMLAGLAMDNTMVYGEIFHMDSALRSFRNICKNFANFGLGAMILFEIIKSVFALGGIKKPLEVIKKAAVAGILIQMSWFIVAALIDISTIATYAIGGMPMSVLKTDNGTINQKILQPNVAINVNNSKKIESKNFVVSYQVKTKEGNTVYLSTCATKEDAKNTNYIVGRTSGDEKFKNQGKLGLGAGKESLNACVYGNQVYFFQEFPDAAKWTGENYSSTLKDILSCEENRDGWEACGYVVRVDGGTPTTKTCKVSDTADSAKAQAYTRYNNPSKVEIGTGDGKARLSGSLATSIGEVIEKSKGFVGPLATIYTSLMDFANLSDISDENGTIGRGLSEVLIRLTVAAGLLFPLAALAIILVIRIGFLRCVIAASPLIVLVKSFDLGKKMKGIEKYIDPANIIKAIFAPVITVFALSIGLIFMSALISTYKGGALKDGFASMGIESTKGGEGELDSINAFGLVIKYPKSINIYAGSTGDWFSRMIVSFAGIGIMWFVLFAAIGATGTIGAVGNKVKEFGENMLKTTPVQIPGLGKVGLGTAFDAISPTKSGWNNATQARSNSDFVNIEGQNKLLEEKLKLNGDLNTTKGKSKDVINLLGKGDYTEAKTKLVGKDAEKTPDEMISLIGNNKDIETFIANMKDEAAQKELLTNWGIEKEREEKTKRETAITKFKTLLKEQPQNKSALDAILGKPEAINVAKADINYKEEVSTKDEKTYTITVKKDRTGLESVLSK